MEFKSYTSINKSTTSGKESFRKNLVSHYGRDYDEVNITNKEGDKFLLFNAPISKVYNRFILTTNESLSLREVSMDSYLSSGYIVSEINSSLKAEGVHSSRKIVDQVIKSKKDGTYKSKDEIEKLVSNYYDALMFILSGKEITERNIFTLYLTLTSDLKENLIEEGQYYRRGDVSIGEDIGMPSNIISHRMKELIEFINSDYPLHHKAIISHYQFENIHPYYDYNGRVGRLLHLWILFNNSASEFWRMTFLSESIYSYKMKLDTTFRKITKAKKHQANIDLTFFVGSMYEIFIDHTDAYIKMKKMVSKMKKAPSRKLRLFIIDMICDVGSKDKWYTINDFKVNYEDYTKTTYDRVLQEIKESEIFEIQIGRPTKFRLKY